MVQKGLLPSPLVGEMLGMRGVHPLVDDGRYCTFINNLF
mgnify:CR=1 FL=1